MTDVFISYKREDKAFAEALARRLAAGGLNVWWDIDLLPGDRFADEIMKVIGHAAATVVLWSQRSATSAFVRAEARAALEQSKLIPARLDEVVPPLPFNDLHTLDLSGWDGSESDPRLKTLLEAVARHIDGARAVPNTETEKQLNLHVNDQEAAYWRSISDQAAPSHAEFKAYLQRYPDGLFRDLAEIRLAESSRRRWPRPLAIAGAIGALLAPLAIIFGLVKDYPAVSAVLGWDKAAAVPGTPAESDGKPSPAIASGELQPSLELGELEALRTVGDAILNAANSGADPAIHIEDLFDKPAPFLSPDARDEARTQIMDYLKDLFPIGEPIAPFAPLQPSGVVVSEAIVRHAVETLFEEYRSRLPEEAARGEPLVPPPLKAIYRHYNGYTRTESQNPEDFSCVDERNFLAFHQTYIEALMLYRAAFLSGYGIRDGFQETAYLARPPQWVPGSFDGYFDGPVPFDRGALTIDLMLSTGLVDTLAPMLIEQAESIDSEWRERIGRFALYMLDYRKIYEELIAKASSPARFEASYLGSVVNEMPNPFSYTAVGAQRFNFVFDFNCNEFQDTCQPVHFFGLGRTESLPRSEIWPGLHQGMVLIWHRRNLAGTDDAFAALLETTANLSTRRFLDFSAIERAIEAGRPDATAD